MERAGVWTMATEGENRRKHVKDYFDGDNRILAWILIVLGTPAIALGGLGLLMMGYGIYLLWQRRRHLSDEQIDKWTEQDFATHNFVERAWQMAGSPQLVRHPTFVRGVAGDILSRGIFKGERWGEDAVWRKTPLAATVILCTADELIVYQTGIDLTTGNRVNERLIEAFYQDVISVGMNSHTETLDLEESVKDVARAKLDAKQLAQGLSKRKLRRIFTRLKTKYREHLVGETLQYEQTRVYQIELSDGDTIAIAVNDGRPTRVANNQDDAAHGDATAQSMISLRAFVREQKQRLLHRYGAQGAGPLV